MIGNLGELLRRGAESVAVPRFDLDQVVAEAGRRRRRRSYLVAGATAAVLSAIAAGSVLIAASNSRTQGPPPAGPPSPSVSKTLGVDGARPLVYAEGRTVHVGDQTVQADKPVAFIIPTDDGAVYQATLDHTLWFTDGTTTEVIGKSGWTAAPTSHSGVVTTGDSGSLVVWADASHGTDKPVDEFVVYDTSRREEVARIPIPPPAAVPAPFGDASVLFVGEDRVYVMPDSVTPGCWAGQNRSHACRHPHVLRLDVATGETTTVPGSELDGALDASARTFQSASQDGRVVYVYPTFAVVRNRLVAGIDNPVVSVDAPVRLADGSELRLRLPTGYVPPAPDVGMSQWLDDTHVTLFTRDGDVPASNGELLTCEVPDGVCRVAVPRTSQPYVAPYLDQPFVNGS